MHNKFFVKKEVMQLTNIYDCLNSVILANLITPKLLKRMKKNLLLLIVLVFTINGYTQISHGGKPMSFHQQGLKSNIDYRIMPELDIQSLLEEDARDEKAGDIAWRFGKEMEVDFNLDNSGNWEILENGDRIWRLEITSYGAYSLNLIYDEFYMPEEAYFFVYNAQKDHVIGSYNSFNNKPGGTFATVPVRGETCILEYYEPLKVKGKGKLSVSHVIHAYKDLLNIAGFGSSGACNVNVNCPEGDEWRDQQRGVAMILNGSNNRICSGSMINNTAEDGTPYFLTANHCGSGHAENWIIMFNYESPSCENIDGPTHQSIQYTTVRATSYISDLLLLELSEEPPLEFNVFYNGWNRSDENGSGSVAIHHPRGDIKKISFDNDPYTADKYLGNQGVEGSYWKVEKWDMGTTEGGSSGSPLFNYQKQIVGQLRGGYASCSNLASDWYGKFSYDWDYFAEPERQLKHWLDPTNSGVTSLDGFDAGGFQYAYDATLYSIVEPQTSYEGEANFSPRVIIKNKGTVNIHSLNVSYRIDDGEIVTQQWSGDLSDGDTAHVIFDPVNLDFGVYQFKAFTDSPNGFDDQYKVNDTLNRQVLVNMNYDIGIGKFISPVGANCDMDTLKLEFYVKNEGIKAIDGISVAVSIDGEPGIVEEISQSMEPGEEFFVKYYLEDEDTDWHSLDLEIGIMGEEDQNPANNSYSTEYNSFGNYVAFTLRTDDNGDQTSWVLKDEDGTILGSGDDYESNEDYKERFCLTLGCYDFILYDDAGDGISIPFGSFKLENHTFNNIYVEDSLFADSLYISFCISNELFCDFTVSADSACTDSDVFFINQSVNADFYSWFFEGGNPIAPNDVNPVIRYKNPGVYDVKLKAWQNDIYIETIKEDYITVVQCNGIEEVKNSLFKIYPNPTPGLISIEVLDQNEFEELFIYNSLGKIMQHKNLDRSEMYQFDLNLPSGLYFVELRSKYKSDKRMLLIN